MARLCIIFSRASGWLQREKFSPSASCLSPKSGAGGGLKWGKIGPCAANMMEDPRDGDSVRVAGRVSRVLVALLRDTNNRPGDRHEGTEMVSARMNKSSSASTKAIPAASVIQSDQTLGASSQLAAASRSCIISTATESTFFYTIP